MTISRRSILAGGASLAAVGSVSALVPRAVGALVPAPMKNLALRRSTFLPLVGQAFQIVHDRGALTVVLSRVRDLKPSVRTGAEDQFSLIFTDATTGRAVRQGTYSIRHARQGRLSLFVTPVGPCQTGQQYEAIIDNRPLSAIS